ncbi:autotransporter outer membrane beta-barrel domain-containing protein [Methylomusa anaerophila]|uniref:Uncharacterized protein n=1 Tax=Methylomusa anaerophila TaxID=1930071 RepID=A0A348AI93_9FIRM|nr:T-complex 10 C-terminal domain-containing protein [Methylomusa anaerophila]BBB90791.1 hypothetical protein MAMMFC1_01452 [Methylomusa anaerophila]
MGGGGWVAQALGIIFPPLQPIVQYYSAAVAIEHGDVLGLITNIGASIGIPQETINYIAEAQSVVTASQTNDWASILAGTVGKQLGIDVGTRKFISEAQVVYNTAENGLEGFLASGFVQQQTLNYLSHVFPPPPKVMPDGTLRQTFYDGSIRDVAPDNTIREISAEGVITVTETDGTKTVYIPNGPTTVYTPDGSVITWRDGIQILTGPDGTTVTTYLDGSRHTIMPDGTQLIWAADGSQTVIAPDGSRIVYGSDGSSTIYAADGSIDMFAADGTETLYEIDGTTTVKTSDGRVTITTADGAVTVLDSDGKRTKYDTNGTTTVFETDGTQISTLPGGTETVVEENGAKMVQGADGSTTEYAVNGDRTIAMANGCQLLTTADGNQALTTADGNQVIFDDNGNLMVTTADGNQINLTTVDGSPVSTTVGDAQVINTAEGFRAVATASGDLLLAMGDDAQALAGGSGSDVVTEQDGDLLATAPNYTGDASDTTLTVQGEGDESSPTYNFQMKVTDPEAIRQFLSNNNTGTAPENNSVNLFQWIGGNGKDVTTNMVSVLGGARAGFLTTATLLAFDPANPKRAERVGAAVGVTAAYGINLGLTQRYHPGDNWLLSQTLDLGGTAVKLYTKSETVARFFSYLSVATDLGQPIPDDTGTQPPEADKPTIDIYVGDDLPQTSEGTLLLQGTLTPSIQNNQPPPVSFQLQVNWPVQQNNIQLNGNDVVPDSNLLLSDTLTSYIASFVAESNDTGALLTSNNSGIQGDGSTNPLIIAATGAELFNQNQSKVA